MKLAIMQPYLFPYLGYYKLLTAADKLVFHDDINFIKNGWINRNRLLLLGEVRYFTIPLRDARSSRRIDEIEVMPPQDWRRKILAQIQQSYGRAPQFAPVFALVTEVLSTQTTLIGELAKQSIAAVAKYLGLAVEFVWTTAAYGNEALKGGGGTDRVLDICKRERATSYYNLPGGVALYDPSVFSTAGIHLHFIDSELPPYAQSSAEFQAGLSIIDVLMWNDRDAVLKMLAPGSGRPQESVA